MTEPKPIRILAIKLSRHFLNFSPYSYDVNVSRVVKIKVELDNLTEKDFELILTQTDNAILKQYKELLNVDGVELKFTDDAIKEIAKIATMENENSENLGARRLHAVMEALLEEVSFNAGGNTEPVTITINQEYVDEHLAGTLKTMNLRRYII